MACEIPALLCIEGEAVDIIHQAGAGVVVPPEDPKSLADAILMLQADSIKRQELGRNGREFVVSHYSREILARRLADVLEKVVNEEG